MIITMKLKGASLHSERWTGPGGERSLGDTGTGTRAVYLSIYLSKYLSIYLSISISIILCGGYHLDPWRHPVVGDGGHQHRPHRPDCRHWPRA